MDMKATREAFGEELVKLAEVNKDIVVVNADLQSSLKLNDFAKAFPERMFQVGVSEQAMAGIGTGLALYGKIPFITSFAAFSPGLNWSQIRLAAMSNANLKIVSSHYGLNVGEDGASAQMLEDVALMRVLPNFMVVTPADYNQTKQALKVIVEHKGSVYMRLTRERFPVFLPEDANFELGKAQLLREGGDVTIVATGTMVYESLQTAEVLSQQGINAAVINLHTIKPLDFETVAASLQKTGKLVTIEEHMIAGGMGSAVLESLGANSPKLQFSKLLIGIEDRFGTSGNGFEVMRQYGLHRDAFVNKITEFLNN